VKGYTSRYPRQECALLRKMSSLWTPNCF